MTSAMSDKVTPELVEKVARAIDDALPESDRFTLAPSQIRRAAQAAISATPLVKMREALEAMPDYIEIFRLMKAGGLNRADQAKAVAERVESIRSAALSSNLEGG